MTAYPFLLDRLEILESASNDLDSIFALFSDAVSYQKKNNYDVWPQFSRSLLETEQAEGRHWKVQDGSTIAAVFSVLYSDPIIWGERDKEPSIYLHRIAVNSCFKGKGLMQVIKAWAITQAKKEGKRFVRMDTWGNNEKLRKYYVNCGFDYIGQCAVKEVNGRPAHYGGPVLSLFQLEV